jgi:hypothetical protein
LYDLPVFLKSFSLLLFFSFISEFNKAKEKAMRSLEELTQLHSSINFGDTNNSELRLSYFPSTDTTPTMTTFTSPDRRLVGKISEEENEDAVLLEESMQESNELLEAFRNSLLYFGNSPPLTMTSQPSHSRSVSGTTNLPTGSLGTTNMSLGTSAGLTEEQQQQLSSSSSQPIDVSVLLDKYSDKLLEMVVEKMQKKK